MGILLPVIGQGLIQAWQLGLSKYPAVMFYARDVVYGTADVKWLSNCAQKEPCHERHLQCPGSSACPEHDVDLWWNACC
ncbi:DUF1525 domain-containing protein [Enterobacter bugandensis]|uniref:DUF1525 domain-containing protein n=1 Tax=Enterobacter bugandensis TaxID=881260 RepID=UPI0035AC24BC